MVVAPHQDDEIFEFCGIIEKNINDGNRVKVVFVSNGDYNGLDNAQTRFQESINALSHIGLSQTDIIIMGYGDSAIAKTYFNGSDNPIESNAGINSTYGVPSLNLYDYHTLEYGESASYTGNNIRNDMFAILEVYRPTTIYTTSEFDRHPDHSFTYKLLEDVITYMSDNNGYHPRLNQSVVHGYDDDKWPNRDSDSFENPFQTEDIPLRWENVERVQLSEAMVIHKRNAIEEFVSQNSEWADFDFAFVKSEEFYWTRQM